MRVFVSYSLRGNDITKEHLVVLRSILRDIISEKSIYIDIFDNPKGYKCSRKTLYCSAHKHVISELEQADVVLMLSNESSSPWVAREIQHASKLNIPILRFATKKLNALLDGCEKRKLSVKYELHQNIHALLKPNPRINCRKCIEAFHTM